MRVLIHIRNNTFNAIGGDAYHAFMVANALEKKGVKVDVSTELEPDLKDYDIVNVFNITWPQEIFVQIKNAKKQGKPCVLTPIYVMWDEFEKRGTYGFRKTVANILPYNCMQYLKILGRAVKNGEFHKGVINVLAGGYFNLMKKTLSFVDLILPNSETEKEKIQRDFNIPENKFFIVPSGIDFELFDYEKTVVDENVRNLVKDGVLCVARITPLKNQLGLIKAFKNLPYKLFIIGEPSPNHKSYLKVLKKEAGDNVFFLGKIPRDKLPQYYKAAKVQALPSWFETTGLVFLEAVSMKCNIVVGNRGYVRDFYRDYAFYCEPDDVNSIREAVIKAYETPFNPEFREHIIKNFSMDVVAKKTLEAYEYVLRNKNG